MQLLRTQVTNVSAENNYGGELSTTKFDIINIRMTTYSYQIVCVYLNGLLVLVGP